MKKIKTLDLFTGLGGTHLALGSITKPVAYCEIDERCVQVIKHRLPRAPIFPDVTKLTAKDLTDGNVAKPQLITASFPCQDISSAGAGEGVRRGTRSGLVLDVFRLVDDIGPSVQLLFLENSPMIRTRGLDKIVRACRRRGFDRIGWTFTSASDVGAHHKRKRWFLLAARSDSAQKLQKLPLVKQWDDFEFQDKDTPRLVPKGVFEEYSQGRQRISALGNAVVPASLAHAWNTLARVFNARLDDTGKGFCDEVPSVVKKDQALKLQFDNGSTNKLWTTPVHTVSHWYPSLKFDGRFKHMLANQVFHELQTQRTFRFKDIIKGRDRYCLNPEWVEALMGFPRGWTNN